MAGGLAVKGISLAMLDSGPFYRSREAHVRQYLWHFIHGHFLWRIARSGDRLRRRWLSAGTRNQRSRYPGRARSPQAGNVAPRHAAPRTGYGRDPLRRLRRQDDRHTDRPPDPQSGPAQQGLRQHRRNLPPGPRRLRLYAEIRLSRLSRRRPFVGARDGGTRRCRCDRAQVAERALRRHDPGLDEPAGADPHSVRRCGADRTEPVLRARRGDRSAARGIHGCAAQVGRLCRRKDQRRGNRRAAGLGRAGLCPPRCRDRLRDDGHQRGEGRRDR